MTKIKQRREGRVLIADVRKALVLRNEGDELYPNLRLERTLEAAPNPPTREQGTDRSGRTAAGERRSALDQTDRHGLAEQDFARTVAAELADLCRRSGLRTLIVVAPPKVLAVLREELPSAVRKRVVAEIGKDLTQRSVHEIERHLT